MLPSTNGRKPAETGAEVAAIHDLAAAVHRWRVGFAARHGLTLTDTVVLTTVIGGVDAAADPAASSDPAVTAAALAHAVGIASGRLTGALDRLDAAGLARRVPNPADRRSVLVAPTEAGREAIEALDGALRAVLADAQDPAFREQFTTRLIRLSGAADRARAELGGGS